MIELKISSKEGCNAAYEEDKFIILNTSLSKELIDEGIAREFISKIQNLRKSKDYNIVDRINIYYENNDNFSESISSYLDLIKKETLAINIEEKETNAEVTNINGIDIKFDIEKYIN
jgi:isoleucyl-tRNA synthetase